MTIKLYWHRGKGRVDASQQNFGDYLSPLIVEAVSGRSVIYAPLKEAEMMAIGTILANEPKARRYGFKRRIHVWGSGCGQPDEQFSDRHYYHAVRGRETKDRILGGGEGMVFGDPGLLAELLVLKPSEKKYKFGFVPHYVDAKRSDVVSFINDSDVHVIDVFAQPELVLEQIASCEFVVSSSLHGLVVADAYGVPNVRVRISTGLIDELKFADYYSAYSMVEPVPMSFEQLRGLCNSDIYNYIETYERPGLCRIKENLIKAFPYA